MSGRWAADATTRRMAQILLWSAFSGMLASALAQRLPAPVQQELRRAGIPPQATAVIVQEVGRRSP